MRTWAVVLLLLLIPTVSSYLVETQEIILQEHNVKFPAVSSPSLSILPNGSLFAVFSEVTYGGIYGKMSNDNGLVWTEPFQIKSSDDSFKAYSNFLIISENQTMLFYSRLVNSSDLSLWKIESFDNGQSWISDTRVDTGTHSYVCTGTNGLRMRNGTLIVPIAWDGNCSILRSDDKGRSWFESQAIRMGDNWNTTLDEPAIVELGNSSLYCLFRTYGYKRHFSALSNDYGLSWTEALPVEELWSFNTTPALYECSNHVIIVAWINRSAGIDAYQRRPLAVAISLDDCNSWHQSRIIDNGILDNEGRRIDPRSRFSMNEPVIIVSKHTLIVGYRRYNDDKTKTPPTSDGVTRILPLNLFATAELISLTFGTNNPCADLNLDGAVNIFDSILFGTRQISSS